ncbi:hypothetical protein XENOCAPTIV_011393 [Xenoophorus captivus]|uniref:Uncharacterized protein n=1 Tax=Xenoophorus captivus TaxID=1517983 RepID=A0ABV0Q9E0_9TELE
MDTFTECFKPQHKSNAVSIQGNPVCRCGSTHHHPTGSFETKTTVPLHPSSGLCQRASLQLGSVCSRSVQWSVSARYRRLSPASLRSLFSATLREPAAISASGT